MSEPFIAPCPFCNADLIEVVAWREKTGKRSYVHPANECVIQSFVLPVSREPRDVERLAKWNTRPAPVVARVAHTPCPWPIGDCPHPSACACANEAEARHA